VAESAPPAPTLPHKGEGGKRIGLDITRGINFMGHARCTLKVEGLDCPTEVAPLRRALEGSEGVVGLGFDLARGTLTIDYEPSAVDPPTLIERVAERTGMRATLANGLTVLENQETRPWVRWAATIGSGIALGIGMGIAWAGGPGWASGVAFGAALLASGFDLFPKVWSSLRGRRLDIHVLMTLAVLGALVLGQWDEAATVAFLFGLSEALEGWSLAHAQRAVRALLEVAPDRAEVIGPDGETKILDARQVRVGDRVRVRAHDRIPVDGQIVTGRSSVDQKAITGESVPLFREPGDEVFAGTVNGEGTLEIVATRPLDDALVSRVIERVRAAQAGRAPVERSIERFAAVYTPIIVALAIGLMIGPPLIQLARGLPAEWATWFARGLVLLVIACPCALVIGTPVAVVSALAAAARRGILVKGGQYLEAFGRLRVLAFDKTGTLTKGEPDVVEVVSAEGQGDADVLRIAAALGDRGGHVLGRAIARHARGLSLEVPTAHDYQAVPGLGASGRIDATQYHIGSHRYIDERGLCPPDFHASLGQAEKGVGTAVALTGSTGPLGWIRLADRPRPEAASVLAELKSLGLQTVMLTGDNRPTAEAMARELGITEQRAGLLPADKADVIADLDARRGPTGMVGDGVNDAPALAAARVSVALGGIASGAALETADIVLMADDLSPLPWLVRHSRRTLARIRQNIALAVGSKLVVLILAVFGLATLWMAIAADVGVSLIVVANALRLLRAGE
jgi:Cd2+/Zn2+-exporting ATPase